MPTENLFRKIRTMNATIENAKAILSNATVKCHQNDIDDVKSETMLRIFQRLEQFDDSKCKFTTWVFGQLKDATGEYYKREEAGKMKTLKGAASIGADAGTVQRVDPVGTYSAISLEDQEQARIILDTLSPENQQLVLNKVDGRLGTNHAKQMAGKRIIDKLKLQFA